ncbi:MAG TPA: UDP-glucose/GDP-mannose dehydrogenase family protein [Nitrospirales bacterium]|jgi:UDPglucose 6-dehydrogenase|nr:UDP-glucose/GDP-mannose dehydrogenase family protein [Nitrospirales bacterium]
MNISVIGTGYVGLVTGACFAEFGVQVTCMDKDERRIAMLEKGEIPIYEPGLAELVRKGLSEGRLTFTTDLGKAVETGLAIFIAVGTPSREDGSTDLSFVEDVGRGIATHLDRYKVIVTKSTVPVGTGERLRELIERDAPLPAHFDIVSNPEFLREGSAIEDFMRPNRVVIGAGSPQAEAIMRDLYRPLYLIETPFVFTDVATAEMIKYASNTFLATKVSFINEVANLCERVGADVQVVARAMGLDHRIGSKFLHAGPGYGGSCFPKDIAALIQTGRQSDCVMEIAEATARANVNQRLRMVEKIRAALGGSLAGKRVAVLGLSFKPNTNDLRDAPSLDIIPKLQEAGAEILAYDPAGLEEARKLLPTITLCANAYEAAAGADGLVLMTEWNQFRNLDLERIKRSLKTPVFVDLRNVYEPARMASLGFRYTSVGRPTPR